MNLIRTRALIDPATRAETGALRFTISTTGEKRDGLDLRMDRFKLANFNRNPVLLWMHGKEARGSLPLGRWQNLAVADKSITGEAVFDQEDAFAVEVERKYRAGYLNAVSVSWIPEKIGDGWRYDMLEASAVGIPADPDALLVGRDFAVVIADFESSYNLPTATVQPVEATPLLKAASRMIEEADALARASDALRIP